MSQTLPRNVGVRQTRQRVRRGCGSGATPGVTSVQTTSAAPVALRTANVGSIPTKLSHHAPTSLLIVRDG